MEQTLVQVNVPDVATKQIAMRKKGQARVITISSNFLTLFDFNKGDHVVEETLGENKGIIVRRVYDLFNQQRVKKVYSRTYKQRRNNPLETMLEISSQRLIEHSFPAGCNRVHVEFNHGVVRITPIHTVKERALSNAKRALNNSVFAALTSGVDLASMAGEGFSVSAVLEWRPPEARDKRDLSETGALNALANSGPVTALFNEDITACVLDRIGHHMEKNPVMVLSASPQCDDLSNVKAQSLKDDAKETGSSTADMIIDVMNLVERIAPPVIVLENVTGMIGSAAYEVACMRFARWGYRRFEHIGDARDYGGLSSRKRAYVVFSMLEAPFSFQPITSSREKPVWDILEPYMADCRDVTHSKSLNDGKACGRLRRITEDSKSSGTPLKSQGRMAKDSLVVETPEGRFLWPTEAMLKRIMGIENVNLEAVSATTAVEIIGQAVDGFHHAGIMSSIKDHISAWENQKMSTSKAAA